MKIPSIKIKDKARGIFVVAICFNLLFLGVSTYVVILIQQKKQHISELKSRIEDLTNQKENLKSIKDNISKTAPLRQLVDSYFVPKDGTVQFLNLIHKLGQENNLTSKVINVDEEVATVSPELFELLNLEVEVSGTWSDVYHFVALIELLPYKVSVGRVDIEKFVEGSGKTVSGATSQVKSASGTWEGTINFKVIKLK